ncbi:hypothetical protein JCM9533A_26240 [Catenuloplanes niger JCM 9533]
MSTYDLPVRRLLVAVDMENYSRRDNVLQFRAQADLQKILASAADDLGFDRSAWWTQPQGDGELAVLPEGTNEIRIVTRLTATLDRLLREHNRGLTEEARVRLRLAMHEGIVHLDGATGAAGAAAVTVCRLRDAEPARAALRRFPHANVVLIISDRLFEDIVRHYHDARPDRFARVVADVPGKGFTEPAWIHVPDEDATLPGPRPDRTAGDDRPAGRSSPDGYRHIHNSGALALGDGNTVSNRQTGRFDDR